MTTTPDTRPASAVEIAEGDWAAGVAALRAAQSAVLVCHVAPDGDALGSMLALAHALRRRGAAVSCSWGDARWSRPAAWDWLPGVELTVAPGDLPRDADVLVILDTGARDRLGVLAPRLEDAPAVVVVDHHAHGGDIEASARLVDPAAAATAVVVEELLRRLDCPLDAEIATCLYAGLVTDTGSFSHPVTTPAVHAVAGRLLAAGARPDEITRRIWGSRPLAVLHLLATALGRVRFDAAAAEGRGMVWTWVDISDLSGNGLALDEADHVMEVIRATREADVAVVVKQDADGAFKVSSRSRGGTDVGAACAALGGGGHRLAAGFTATGELAGAEPAAIVAAFASRLR